MDVVGVAAHAPVAAMQIAEPPIRNAAANWLKIDFDIVDTPTFQTPPTDQRGSGSLGSFAHIMLSSGRGHLPCIMDYALFAEQPTREVERFEGL